MASRSFSSMADLAAHLASFPSRMNDAKATALDQIGKQAADTARSKIGQYQEQSGPFPQWPQLRPNTIIERIMLGFAPNDPLLREGDLRDSIRSEVNGDTVTAGSSDPIAGYQEHGTDTIPPRPFVGPAMLETEPDAKEALRQAVGKALDG